ncbi:4-hydroxythreonine-4-phosphate dehydrogenase PdxA [Mycolicibacterium obuense]|uniref:4-hydroxythreonine-4-phosphate dehydrogenase 2 n=1 Tax=Mycolicibacterium obuense TaxID=1807 RepID=A0A0J6Y9D4_9MYCO|nr:4-hydroxythreonine-4-phosphate dehydrogenase PdxA [Mycolicibacterium obuense]KMO69556.1 4-hydroxythreonine-4-phosphate dehydrogenase 2 [Mycolicibacterium obuense]
MSTSADILVLADDLSGAAEAAASFLGRVPEARLVLDPAHADLSGVTVVDLNTRAAPPSQTDSVLESTLDRSPADRLTIVKIDSLLRGHIGSTVDVLADRGPVVVAAGLPGLGRTVRDGVLHVDGVPLHRTDLWHLEPAPPPLSITDVVRRRSRICSSPADIAVAVADGAVAICDVASDADLDAALAAARRVPGVQLVGTAALTAALARTLDAISPVPIAESNWHSVILTVVGTGARNATAQVAALVGAGAVPITVAADELLTGTAESSGLAEALSTHAQVVLTITGSVPAAQRTALASRLGAHVAAVDRGARQRPDLVLTGGETARAVIDALGYDALRPVDVVHHGAVVSVASDGRRIVTRPGSFGDRDSFIDIAGHLSSSRADRVSPTHHPMLSPTHHPMLSPTHHPMFSPTHQLKGTTMTPNSGTAALPVVAVTMGDGAGIGPEVIVPALLDDAVAGWCVPVVIGDAKRLTQAADILGITCDIVAVDTVGDARVAPGRINVIDLDLLPADLPWGELSAVAGNAAYEYIRVASELAVRGEVQAICTAPLNKEALHAAGHIYPGHTELLAHLTGTEEVSMMLSSPKLKVIHVTTHIGLLDAVAKIEPGLVERTVRRGHDALVRSGNPHPKIGLCGINPHAGENGLFGYGEEDQKIVPAVEALVADGIDAHGPLPADTAFFLAGRGDYDLIVAMYHDQGHGPVKVLGIEAGVNITVGLPVIRTSVDHGTAFDIAGKGIAEAGSMVEALRQAAELATSTTVLN